MPPHHNAACESFDSLVAQFQFIRKCYKEAASHDEKVQLVKDAQKIVAEVQELLNKRPACPRPSLEPTV